MAESEVARLMRQIELECEAMKLAMTGYTIVSNHRTIRRKYEAIGAMQKKLEAQLGEKEASRR
jgi:hypothetical protein